MAGMLLAAAFGHAVAQEETAAGLRFRRVLAPEDRLKDWPIGDGKYLPIDATEFDRMIEAEQARAAKSPLTPGAAIVSAHYEARLIDDHLVGQALVNVVLAGPAPAMLPFEPCNLAMEKTAWEQPEGDAKTPARAALGLAGNGKLEAVVDRSGSLRFEWSLAGRRDSADILGFLFELPSAPANELLVELPKAFTPSIDHGVVIGSEAVGEDSRRWRIELGGRHRFRMRILPAGVVGHRPQLALLRESRTYDFTLRGVEVTALWRIQAHNEPLQQINVLLDPGLQLVSARDGDSPIPWTTAPANGDERTRVVLTLPEPILDAERVVRLAAIGRPVLDRLWRLPGIHAQSLFWQEGNLTLLTPEPLVADRIVPFGCGQTGTSPLSAPRAGESVQFQAFEPDATVELLLSRRPAAMQATVATAIELGSEEVAARVVTEFRATEGTRFTLEADVSRQWIIDSVESTPPGSVADWTLEPRTNRNQLLTVRLGSGLSPAKPLRLAITARRLFSPSLQKLGIDELVPLRFRSVTDGKRLVAVRPASSYALKLSGDEQLKRLRPDRLTATELGLFSESPQDLLFEHDAKANPLEVALIAEKAKYSGTIQIDATISDEGLRESCDIRCAAETGRVDRVLVQFYPRRDDVPRWRLDSEDDQQISARKWSNEEQAAAGADTSVEIWELTLRRPRSAPFVITAVRHVATRHEKSETEGGTSLRNEGRDSQTATPFVPQGRATQTSSHNAPVVLSLVSLPEATSQRGTVSVRSAGAMGIHIDNRRLKPILPEPLAPGRSQAIRGVYRYDPSRDVAEGTAAALRVSTQDEPNVASTWAYNCRLESWYQSDGAQRHQATYNLQSAGRGPFRLKLPPGVARENVRGVWIDGEPVEWQLAATDDQHHLTVQLPARRKFPNVTIQWTASGSRLGIAGSLDVPLPEPDLPTLARNWTAWLPPGYECIGSDSRWPAFGGMSLTWSRRLFGPLGRDAGMDRFDPLSTSDWMAPLDEYRSREPVAAGVEDHPVQPESADMLGWTAWRTDLPTETPPTLEYVHCTSMQLLGTITFLLCVAIGRWTATNRPALLVALLGVFSAAAMLLPVAQAPIASGGVLGILFCLVWRWIRPQAPIPVAEETVATNPPAKKSPGSTVSMAGQLGLMLIAALLALLPGSVARGETPPAQAESPMYRVFVPIDAEKKPTGANVYVPEPFYQELYRRAAAPAEKPKGWLILKASYRGTLAGEAVSGHLAVDTLRAEYDLRVFGRTTRVRIPLRAEGANLIPNGVLLDGRPIEPEWEPDVAALAFEVAEPGDYRLEVLLRPTMRNAGGPAGIDIGIPRVANSRFELTLPDNAPPVEVPSACGKVVLEKPENSPPQLLADLGPADRLTVRWHEGAVSSAPGPAIDVEQFVWLKFQPGSVVISTKFKLHAVEGQIQQVQLAADPRLRLLPLPGVDAPTVQTGPETGQARLIAFRWSHVVGEQVTLDATFLLSGAAGVGNFHLPKIELLDARPTKRWMAVSVDPALEREEQQKQKLETVPVSDFLKAWGAADATPLFAYRLPGGETDWTISTRPHEARTTANQALTLSCDEDHVDVLFEAQLATMSGYLFQHRVTVPEGLKIEDIVLLEDDVDRVSRWSKNPDGTVTIFLNGAASGPQKLVLRGYLPIVAGKAWPLPQIRVERCEIRSTTVRLFRRPSVLLTIDGAGPRTDAENNATESDLGRFVDAFSYDAVQPLAVTVTTKLNNPTIQADIEASAEPVQAIIEPAAASLGVSFVRLADVTLNWAADGNCYGAATFDLEPGGADECPLCMPAGYDIVQASVEEIPVSPKAVGEGVWRFSLISQRLPQRVEVLFRGRLPNVDQTGSQHFTVPNLGDLPVRQTLWTVVGPPSWTANDPDDETAVSPWKQELLRFKSAAAAIDSAYATASDDSDETSRWYPPWARRMVAARVALQRELAAAGTGKEIASAKQAADAIARQNVDLAKRLGTTDVLTQLSKASPAADGPGEILRRSSDTVQPTVRCAIDGQAETLTLECQPAVRERFSERLAVAAGLALLASLVVVGLVAGNLAERWQRWPYATGVAVGLAWWLWLSPSILGLGIALASVLAAGRSRMAAKS